MNWFKKKVEEEKEEVVKTKCQVNGHLFEEFGPLEKPCNFLIVNWDGDYRIIDKAIKIRATYGVCVRCQHYNIFNDCIEYMNEDGEWKAVKDNLNCGRYMFLFGEDFETTYTVAVGMVEGITELAFINYS